MLWEMTMRPNMKIKAHVHLEKSTVVFYCRICQEQESLWGLSSVKGKIRAYAVVQSRKVENKALDSIVYIRAEL